MSVLDGIRVVEYSAFVAAPFAGATLSSLGAEVIRIEQRGGGVDTHRWPLYGGRSLYRMGLDQGKRSVSLDLTTKSGQELASAIVAAPGDHAGIFVTNLGATGWASYENLVRARPDLIMLVISGTRDNHIAVDYTVNAGIGFPLITGPSDMQGPVNHVLPAWDVSAGLYAAIGILAAERHRLSTGAGQLINLALSDVALTTASRLGYLKEALLIEEPRPRLGNELFGTYGRDFRTSDDHFVMILALTPSQWERLGEATGLTNTFDEIAAQHGVDLREEGARFRHRSEISALLEDWVGSRQLGEVVEVLDANRVLFSPYRTFQEFVREDQYATTPPATPLTFSASINDAPPLVSDIGADTKDVLCELLGITDNQIAELHDAAIID